MTNSGHARDVFTAGKVVFRRMSGSLTFEKGENHNAPEHVLRP
jgi:hypothetical protein